MRLAPPKAGLRHCTGPTSTVGSAEASSSGPRPAQGIFRDVHAAAKYDWTLFAAPRRREPVRHFGVRDSQKVHLPFMIRTFFHRIITAYKETISLCDFLSPYQTKQEAPPHGGASCFVPAKRVNPFCRKSFRCALRLGWPLASLRHSAPRKVFFATYTPPQKTDWIFFAPCAARTL